LRGWRIVRAALTGVGLALAVLFLFLYGWGR
jgi:hypothetical protein